MSFDYFTISSLVEELRSELLVAQITAVLRLSSYDLQLEMGKKRYLMLSCSPRFARIFLSAESAALEEPKPWQLRYLQGATIKKIEQVGTDRIIRFDLIKQDRVGTTTRSLLIVELMGRNSNIILVDEEGVVIDALRGVTAQMSRFRQILPKLRYTAPPPQYRIDPRRDSFKEFRRKLSQGPEMGVTEALVQTIAGISESVAKEIAFGSGIPPEEKLCHLDDDAFVALWEKASSLFCQFQPSKEEAFLILDEKGTPIDFSSVDLSWIPSAPNDRFICSGPASKIHLSSVSKAIEYFFSRKINAERKGQLKRSISKSLDKSISFSYKKLNHLRGDLADAENADLFKIKAELLMANIHQIKRGQEEVKLVNIYHPQGEELSIALVPTLSPAENARRYFRKYSKARAGKRIIEQRLASENERLQKLESYRDRMGKLTEYEDLASLRDELVSEGYLKAEGKAGRVGGAKKGGSVAPRRYVTSDGWRVLVGRNDRENDLLSLKVAAPDDLWFHAQACPGSHVILRREGRRDEPSRKALEEAAGVAAYWSKARGSKTVPVSYTLAKYVSKPRDAKPGSVTIRREKTLFVMPQLIREAQ